MAGILTPFTHALPLVVRPPVSVDLSPNDLQMLDYMVRSLQAACPFLRGRPWAEACPLALLMLWDCEQGLRRSDHAFHLLPLSTQRERILAKLKTLDLTAVLKSKNAQTALAEFFEHSEFASKIGQEGARERSQFMAWALRQQQVEVDVRSPGFILYEYLHHLAVYASRLESFHTALSELRAKRTALAASRPAGSGGAAAAAPADHELLALEQRCQDLAQSLAEQRAIFRDKSQILEGNGSAIEYLGALSRDFDPRDAHRQLARYEAHLHDAARDSAIELRPFDVTPYEQPFRTARAALRQELESAYHLTAARLLRAEETVLDTPVVPGQAVQADRPVFLVRTEGAQKTRLLFPRAPNPGAHLPVSISHYYLHRCRELGVTAHSRLFAYAINGQPWEHGQARIRLMESLLGPVALGLSLLQCYAKLKQELQAQPEALAQKVRRAFAAELYGDLKLESCDAAQAARVEVYTHVALTGIQTAVSDERQAAALLDRTFSFLREPERGASVYVAPQAVTLQTTIAELPGFLNFLQSIELAGPDEKFNDLHTRVWNLIQPHCISGQPTAQQVERAVLALRTIAPHRAILKTNPRALARAVVTELGKVSLEGLAQFDHDEEGDRLKPLAAHAFAPQYCRLLLTEAQQQAFIHEHGLSHVLKLHPRSQEGSSLSVVPERPVKSIQEIKADLVKALTQGLALLDATQAEAQAQALVKAYWEALGRAERRILERHEAGPPGVFLQLMENMVRDLGSVALSQQGIKAYIKQLEAERDYFANLEPTQPPGNSSAQNMSGLGPELCFKEGNIERSSQEFLALVSTGPVASQFKPAHYTIRAPERDVVPGLFNLYGLRGPLIGRSASPFDFCVSDGRGHTANLRLHFNTEKKEGQFYLLVRTHQKPTDQQIAILVTMTLHNAKHDHNVFQLTGKAAQEKALFKQFAKALLAQRPDAKLLCPGVEKNAKNQLTEPVTADEQKAWLAEAKQELQAELMAICTTDRHKQALTSPAQVEYREPLLGGAGRLCPAIGDLAVMPPRPADRPAPPLGPRGATSTRPPQRALARPGPLGVGPAAASSSGSLAFDNPIYHEDVYAGHWPSPGGAGPEYAGVEGDYDEILPPSPGSLSGHRPSSMATLAARQSHSGPLRRSTRSPASSDAVKSKAARTARPSGGIIGRFFGRRSSRTGSDSVEMQSLVDSSEPESP